ncbi:leucine-rich repeat-containing protein 46 isoform X1 [Tyto alba]|uniref:leucine-rich repeat-containing protein 46 isoform X1 n=1 Tax=Tyto alba TaxID=56313 RepID=UPI001C662F27|nr:leucine-rich repeat-containing protein 46 isoform X1 [Tyto alba]
MAKPEKTLLGDCELTSPGVTLTDSLIATRSQPRPVEPLRPESQSTELPSPSTVRLDRENICAIGRRQSLREIHSLYLQQVPLPGWKLHPQSGEPAAPATSARPGLVPQPDTDAGPRWEAGTGPDVAWVCPRGASEELPRSLRLLDLTGNECTHQHGYRKLVVGALPHLLQLDAQPIHGSVGEEEEKGGSSSSEDEDNELLSEPSDPFTADKDFFADLHQELAGRSRRRQREALEEHWTRLKELEELQERRGLLLPPAPLSPGREGAACAAAPGAKRSQPCPQTKLGTRLPPLPASCQQPQRAPSGSQSRTKAPEEETGTKGARNRRLPQIPHTSTAPRGWD